MTPPTEQIGINSRVGMRAGCVTVATPRAHRFPSSTKVRELMNFSRATAIKDYFHFLYWNNVIRHNEAPNKILVEDVPKSPDWMPLFLASLTFCVEIISRNIDDEVRV